MNVSCKIIFYDDNKGVFNSGRTVTGKVEFEVEKTEVFRSEYLHFVVTFRRSA